MILGVIADFFAYFLFVDDGSILFLILVALCFVVMVDPILCSRSAVHCEFVIQSSL